MEQLEGDGSYGFFYNNEFFYGQTVRFAITTFEFVWNLEPPMIGINKENYSLMYIYLNRFEAYIKVTSTGRYLFKLESDGKSELHFNGRKIIDKTNISTDLTTGLSNYRKEKESGAQFMIAN